LPGEWLIPQVHPKATWDPPVLPGWFLSSAKNSMLKLLWWVVVLLRKLWNTLQLAVPWFWLGIPWFYCCSRVCCGFQSSSEGFHGLDGFHACAAEFKALWSDFVMLKRIPVI
jgi:hypothetical protein